MTDHKTAEQLAVQRIRHLLAGEPYLMEVLPEVAETMVYRYSEIHRLEGEELRQMFLKFETKLACEMIDPRSYLPGETT